MTKTTEKRIKDLEIALERTVGVMQQLADAYTTQGEAYQRMGDRYQELLALVALIASKRLGMSMNLINKFRDEACLAQKQARLEWLYSGGEELPDVDDPLN